MGDTRKKNANWNISTNVDGTTPTAECQLAVLMDIRDELRWLNALLNCPNFTDIPSILKVIRSNTAKPKKRRRKTGAK